MTRDSHTEGVWFAMATELSEVIQSNARRLRVVRQESYRAEDDEEGMDSEDDMEELAPMLPEQRSESESSNTALINFAFMAILFSANHGCWVSCLAFSTLYLGSTGAWELSLFHLIYALSALSGATYIVKMIGARNSMIVGMALCAIYVGCFWLSLEWNFIQGYLAVTGAVMGGMGVGLVWTAQGSYFARASEEYAKIDRTRSKEESTSLLAGIFAFIYLVEEVVCKLLSWLLLQTEGSTSNSVMEVYTSVAVISTGLMLFINDYPPSLSERMTSTGYKMTAAWQLLKRDPKMKYMIGLNAVFGFASPLINAYVNGEVVTQVLPHDTKMRSVGLLSAASSGVAAICSILFGTLSPRNKGLPLFVGCLCFSMVAMPLLLYPRVQTWGVSTLIAVYCFHGVGRSSFEGALKGTFADFFPVEKEGAFANIILQNGAFMSLGYYLAYSIPCTTDFGVDCVPFKDGSHHNMLLLELAVVVGALAGFLGYRRASFLRLRDTTANRREELLSGAKDNTAFRLVAANEDAIDDHDNVLA